MRLGRLKSYETDDCDLRRGREHWAGVDMNILLFSIILFSVFFFLRLHLGSFRAHKPLLAAWCWLCSDGVFVFFFSADFTDRSLVTGGQIDVLLAHF